jgi:hypothetical protein
MPNLLESREGDHDHPSWKKAAELAREMGVTVRTKSESKLQRLIGVLLFFNPSYMTGFITTIGRGIWVPDSWAYRSRTASDSCTLVHELTHVHQYEKVPWPLFYMGYLFPQVLAPLALLALLAIPLSNLWLLNLLWLIMAAPIPAPFRAMYEAEAYAVSYLMSYWSIGKDAPSPPLGADGILHGVAGRSDHLKLLYRIPHFTGWNYYRMWPSERGVAEWIAHHLQATSDGEWGQTNPIVERAHRLYIGKP